MGRQRDLALRLVETGYDASGVERLLGPNASTAFERGDDLASLRRLRDDASPLATLVRLLLLADSVDRSDLQAALGDTFDVVAPMLDGGSKVRSRIEIAPYAADDRDWYVAADWPTARTGEPLADEHVLGVGGASTMLAQCTVRRPVGDALDVGTGCGVQSLHLAEHSRRVVATDVSRRCLDLARLTFAMNDVEVDVRQGSLFEPVTGERFDLAVSNPPFVIGSPAREQHVYRDSGLAGDEVCARIVRSMTDHLAPGGFGQLLANWEIRDGESWRHSPLSWLSGSPLDAWVVQREVQDPVAYVQMWLRDSGADRTPDYARRYDEWLSTLELRKVVGIGFGLVSLQAADRDEPVRRLQHADQPVAQPVGPDVDRWFRAQDILCAHPGAEVLTVPLVVGSDVRVDQARRPGGLGDLEVAVVRETGFRFSGTLDPFGVALLDDLAAAQGTRPVGELVAARAVAEGLDAAETLTAAVPVLRRLLEEGFLTP